MSGLRAHLGRRDLLELTRTAFAGRDLVPVQRLRGSTKKGVYRLTLDDDTTAIAYVWNTDEDYWPDDQDQGGPFGHATGLDLFLAAHTELSGIGVRVPHMILHDSSQNIVPGDVAVLEDIRGGALSQHAKPVLARLGEAVHAMHHHRSDRYGRPGDDHGCSTVTPPIGLRCRTS